MIPTFLGTAVAVIPRYWKFALIAVLLASIGILKFSLAGEQRHAAKLQQQLSESIAICDRFRADVAAKVALAKAHDEANARRVERDQTLISQETVSAYQKEIADLRGRAAQRMRSGTPPTNPGSGSIQTMPEVPNTTSGTHGAASEDGLPDADGLIASEIAVRLKALQGWVSEQEQVHR